MLDLLRNQVLRRSEVIGQAILPSSKYQHEGLPNRQYQVDAVLRAPSNRSTGLPVCGSVISLSCCVTAIFQVLELYQRLLLTSRITCLSQCAARFLATSQWNVNSLSAPTGHGISTLFCLCRQFAHNVGVSVLICRSLRSFHVLLDETEVGTYEKRFAIFFNA